MTHLISKYLISLLLLVFAAGQGHAQSLESHEWNKQSGDAFFEGTLKRSKIRFRTGDSRILIDSTESIEKLSSYGLDGQRIRSIQLGKSAHSQATALDDEAPYNSDDDSEPEDPLSERESFFENSVARVRTDLNEKPTVTRRLFAHLGFGSESLEAEGGISSFDSTTNIGGTNAVFHLARMNDAALRRYGFSLYAGAHTHTSTTREESSGDLSFGESEKSFFRSYVDLLATYYFDQFIRSANQELALGLGMGLYRTPLMSISNSTTGESTPTMKSSYGPVLSALYRLRVFNSHYLELNTRMQFLGFGDLKKSLRWHSALQWNYFLDEFKFLLLGYGLYQESSEASLSCPAVSSCKSSSTTSASASALQLGLGVQF